jgi:hypothetical protein
VLFRVSTSVYQNPAYRTLNETALRNLVNQLYELEIKTIFLLTAVVAVYVTILIAKLGG